MRNKEVVATGTLLNNGQQVLFVKYLRSIKSDSYSKAITSLPLRKEVVWKHGTPFPGTHHTIIRKFVPDRQSFIISKFVCVSSKCCTTVLLVLPSFIQDHSGRPDPCLPHCGRHHASLIGERELFQESNNFNSVKNLSLRKWERGMTHTFVSDICRDRGEGRKLSYTLTQITHLRHYKIYLSSNILFVVLP